MLEEYITQAGFATDPKGWLFRTAASKNGTALTDTAMCQQDDHAMISHRAGTPGANGISAASGSAPAPDSFRLHIRRSPDPADSCTNRRCPEPSQRLEYLSPLQRLLQLWSCDNQNRVQPSSVRLDEA